MKNHLLSAATILLALFFTTAAARAEYVIYIMTEALSGYYFSENSSEDNTTFNRLRGSGKYLLCYSTLGNDAYAFYILDDRNRIAVKYEGDFSDGAGKTFPFINKKGTSYTDVLEQFNSSFQQNLVTQLPMVTSNFCSGDLQGARSLVRLPQAGFSISAARTLKGTFTRSILSDAAASVTTASPDNSIASLGLSVPALFTPTAEGCFYLNSTSKLNCRMDTRLSDQCNALGGNLNNAVSICDAFLTSGSRPYTLIDTGGAAPEPF